jgi:hypothetical protein
VSYVAESSSVLLSHQESHMGDGVPITGCGCVGDVTTVTIGPDLWVVDTAVVARQ